MWKQLIFMASIAILAASNSCMMIKYQSISYPWWSSWFCWIQKAFEIL